jgi:hypothetical protein
MTSCRSWPSAEATWCGWPRQNRRAGDAWHRDARAGPGTVAWCQQRSTGDRFRVELAGLYRSEHNDLAALPARCLHAGTEPEHSTRETARAVV